MTEKNTGIGSAMPTFIEQVINQVDQGLIIKGFVTCPESEAHIKLELSAVEEIQKEGNIIIRIASFGASKSNANAQRITVFAKKKRDINIL